MGVEDTLLTDLKKAKVFEEVRVLGYIEFLSLSNLTEEERKELQEGLNFSSERVSKLSHTISSLTDLLADGYPNRDKQTAPLEVLSALKDKLSAMQETFAEFDISLTASITFTNV